MRYLSATSTYLLQLLVLLSINVIGQPQGNKKVPTPKQLYEQQLVNEGYHSLTDPEIKTGNRYLLSKFKFKEQSNQFVGDSSAFNELFKFLATNHDFWFEIAVHDYKYWDQDYKKDVTQTRATEISNYLITKGIDPQRIFPKGHAFKYPIVSYAEVKPWWGEIDDKQAIRYNERVELVLMRRFKKKTATKNHIKFALQSGRTDSLVSRLVIGQKFLVPGIEFNSKYDPAASDFSYLRRFEAQHPEIESYNLIIFDPQSGPGNQHAKESKKLVKKTMKLINETAVQIRPTVISRIHESELQLFQDHYLQFINQPHLDQYRNANRHMILEVTKLKSE